MCKLTNDCMFLNGYKQVSQQAVSDVTYQHGVLIETGVFSAPVRNLIRIELRAKALRFLSVPHLGQSISGPLVSW